MLEEEGCGWRRTESGDTLLFLLSAGWKLNFQKSLSFNHASGKHYEHSPLADPGCGTRSLQRERSRGSRQEKTAGSSCSQSLPSPPARPSNTHSPVSTPVFTAVGVSLSILQMHKLKPTSTPMQQDGGEGRPLRSRSPSSWAVSTA